MLVSHRLTEGFGRIEQRRSVVKDLVWGMFGMSRLTGTEKKGENVSTGDFREANRVEQILVADWRLSKDAVAPLRLK